MHWPIQKENSVEKNIWSKLSITIQESSCIIPTYLQKKSLSLKYLCLKNSKILEERIQKSSGIYFKKIKSVTSVWKYGSITSFLCYYKTMMKLFLILMDITNIFKNLTKIYHSGIERCHFLSSQVT